MKPLILTIVVLSSCAPLAAQGASDWDTHTHTYCSDGIKTPEAVVKDAQAAGIRFLAVTDHDNVLCTDRAREEMLRLGITPIPGIEIGAEGDGVHILGLGIDTGDRGLRALTENAASERVVRAKRIIAGLTAMNVPLDFKIDLLLPRLNRERETDSLAWLTADEAGAMSEEDLVSQLRGPVVLPNIASAMAARGYVADAREAFTRYLGDEAPNGLKVPLNGPSFKDAIALIHAAGGVAILAHPYTIYGRKPFPREFGGRTYQDFEALARGMLDAGLDGFEYYRPGWQNFQKDSAKIDAIVTAYLAQHAGRRILFSAGSDYHGYDQEKGGSGPPAPGGIDYPEAEAQKLKAALGLP